MRGTSMGARRGRLAARLLVGVLTCAGLAFGPAGVFAATAVTPYEFDGIPAPDPQLESRFPERLVDTSDLTGDGVRDVFASTYLLDVNGVEDVGRVYLFNGATRDLVYHLDAPDQQEGANFGFYNWAFGDADRDGFEDVAVGAPNLDVDGNEDQGRLYVFSGRTGSLIRRIDHPDPQTDAGFAGRIGAAGDVDRDGVPDVIVGATDQDLPDGRKDAGKAYVLSGANGNVLREYEIPEGDAQCAVSGVHNPDVSCGSLGYTPQAIGDLNRDGVPDHMVGAATLRPTPDRQGRIYVFSGADGEVLTRIDQPATDETALFGLQDTDEFTPGDLTGDGVPEIYGSAFRHDRDGLVSAGRAWVFDGAASLRAGEGVVLYELRDPNPAEGQAFGWAVSRTDYNHDATPDLFVSNLANHEPGSNVPQEAYVFDGRDGSLLKRLELPPSEAQSTGVDDRGSGFGWSSRAPGDLNGDCEPDYVAAAPFQNVDGTRDVGELYFMLSDGPSACPAQQPQQPQQPQPPAVNPCGTPGAAGYLYPAKIRVSRARVLRKDRRLDVLAPITARAEGDVRVTFHADNRRDTFDAAVTEANTELDRISILEPITRGQAELGTGIVNLEYLGDADTRPEFVRLRAASQRAELDVDEISLIGDRLSATGSVTSRAEGVVRFRYSYVDPDGKPQVHIARATIQDDGDWALEGDQVPAQLAQCGGYLSIQFTGYFERRIRGEQLAYQLSAGQTRRP